MAFTITPNVDVERDAQGVIRHLRHLQEPYVSTGLAAPTPRAMAMDYVRDAATIYGIDHSLLSDLGKQVGKELIEEGSQLRFAEEKSLMGTTVVSYVQTYFGLPIWEAGVSVTLQDKPLRVTSSQSTVHFDVQVQKPGPSAKFMSARISPAKLAQAPGLKETDTRPKINSTRLLIYRYDPAMRFDPESASGKQDEIGLQGGPPTLPLPPVPRTIKAGTHYVVMEVLFTLALPGWGDVNWRAFIEAQTGAVLYLRAFVASATGQIFQTDPLTATGNTAITAASPAATLDPLRTSVTLNGLTAPAPGNPQALTGQFVQLTDLQSRTVAPPTDPLPGNFAYSAVTDNFAAVNAYHHVDALFRMVQDMGFNIANYFDGTTFPVPVDHQGEGDPPAVNAHCFGNATSTGVGRMTFGVEQSGQPVGIAADVRVVMHEFSHALLEDSVHSPNFGFAHSAGDSLGAILNDPGSQAPDRFLTFPWTPITRRHDRPVAGGWAWGGANDVGGYSSEQILSTTLFRIYRMTGGDSGDPNPAGRLAMQRFAARWMAYLIIRGIGSLATSPITPTPTPNVFATALMNADTGTTLFDGIPGGAIQKVIRWGFEKQGLYQPAGAPAPVTTEGAPPLIDVYIDDGRNGEYAPFLDDFWETTEIWNRLTATPGVGPADHETPVTTVTNYVYVRVKNRGSQMANNVVVRGFHCRPSTGLVWPDDWQAMTTAQINVAGGVTPGATVTVGPFEWTPTEVGHECLLMDVSASGDVSNADPASLFPSATGPIPHWRLVPFDNNIAQRNVAPVAGGGGGLNLANSFEHRHFWANNPYDHPVRVVLNALMPDFLRERQWDLQFLNPGGASFTLGPRGNREVIMSLKQGKDFSPSDVERAGTRAVITVRTLIDGLAIGGMTYAIDPRLKTPAVETPTGVRKPDCTDAAKQLLTCLQLPNDKVKSVRVTRITVEIDLKENC